MDSLNSSNLGFPRATSQIATGSNIKVGSASGWATGAATNFPVSTLTESQTASTLVVPLNEIKAGDVITGFSPIGIIQTTGATFTLDISLRRHTNVITGATTINISSMTQAVGITNTLMSDSSSSFLYTSVVNESYSYLLTATTGASCTMTLQGIKTSFNQS